MAAFSYGTITENTNFEPLGIEIRRDGVLLAELGVVVTITIKERDRKDVDGNRLVVVEDAPATPHEQIVGRWEYWLTPEQVENITGTRVWLIEWKISFGEYTYRNDEPAILVIRKKL